MDLEPHLLNKKSSEIEPPLLNHETDKPTYEDDKDPYSFASTSTSLIGLAIVFLMLGIPLLAVINEIPKTKKSTIQTSIGKYGSESSSSFTISGISKSSC